MEGIAQLTLETLDRQWTLAVNGCHCEVSDWLWQLCSIQEVWYPLYAVILFFLIYRLGWKRGLLIALAAALTIVVCDQGANLAKYVFHRPRPCNDADMLEGGLRLLEKGSTSFSFFSAHAANAFGLATVTLVGFCQDKKNPYAWYGFTMYVWAAMLGISRVFVGKHFVGDVIVGALFGVAVGALMAALARSLTKPVSPPPSESPANP